MSTVPATIREFLEFVNSTGSPFHSVAAVKGILKATGFQELKEADSWKLKTGGKYFVTRNHAAVCAFAIGDGFGKSKDRIGGFHMVAGHSDSPCLRIRPNSAITNCGYLQLGVECYGGGLWHTWFDRGLGLAGKVIVKAADGRIQERLVRISKPIVMIPNLSIHMTTAAERDAFKFNTENNLVPIVCSQIKDALLTPKPAKENEKLTAHHPVLLSTLAAELKCNPDDIADLDVCLMDATPGRVCGIHEEFIESPRLDNLVSTFACFKALATTPMTSSEDIAVAVSFDHEEVGSQSYAGANSAMMETWIRRVLKGLEAPENPLESRLHEVMQKSFLVSADMAHGHHPNYPDRHQAQHRPVIHKGIVLKVNGNMRYTSHAATMALLRAVAAKAEPPVPIQEFCVKNDCPCGSTIGPCLSSQLGVRAVDIGAPQWAMHSIRETCGTDDIDHLVRLCKTFYAKFAEVDAKFEQAN